MLVISSFFVYFSFAYAQNSHVEKEALQSLITKVEHAKPSQRRLLMNELKVHLRQMHQSERTRVMLGLRRAFNTRTNASHTLPRQHTTLRHENTMNLAESKHMQEHKQEPNKTRPTGKGPEHTQPQGGTPPVDNHAPVRDTSKNKPTTQNTPSEKPHPTKPDSKRGR